MKNLARATAVLMTFLAINSIAGIRGPGKYHGVVVFDRWDTCYIYSSVYLMYVSTKAKEPLREYEGRSMVIDALRVDQPMNPGDGRIDRFAIIGPASSRRPQCRIDGLLIRVSPLFTVGSPKFVLEIRNRGKRKVEVQSRELALTLLGKKTDRSRHFFDPSDGLSTALITRNSLGDSRSAGSSNNGDDRCFWTIGDKPLPDSFTIESGHNKLITISLVLPRGQYDFLCGYGGGVHEDKSLASNIVAFDVQENSLATVVNISRR